LPVLSGATGFTESVRRQGCGNDAGVASSVHLWQRLCISASTALNNRARQFAAAGNYNKAGCVRSRKNGEFKERELRIPPEAYGLNRRKSVSK
jgi:hypothetical protein